MIAHLRFYFCIILFAMTFNGVAQDFSISGKVVDDQNQPLSLVSVILHRYKGDVESSSGLAYAKGTASNDDGTFIIENLEPNTYHIYVSFIGFETYGQKIVLTGHLDLKTIQLNEIPESLDEVTVVAKKPTFTRKPDRLIFNIENTALTEGSTLSVLKSTPGVIVSESGINIKSSQATVYINNRRVQLTQAELIQLLESAPANSIKSVEVITNPPASYDADSGSVINIIMSKNLVTGYRGSVHSNYTQGVFPRYNVGTSHYFKNNKINLNVNYNYTNQKINRHNDDSVDFLDTSNEVEEIWRTDMNRNTWSELHNLNLNFDYFIDDRNTFSITSSGLYMPYFKYQIKNNTNIFDANENFDSRFTSNSLSRDNKYNIGTDIIFKHDFKNDASLTLNGHFTLYDYDRNQNVISNFFDGNNMFTDSSEFNTLANQDTKITTGKIDYNLPISDSSSFEAGLKYSNVSTESDITRIDIINGYEVVDANSSDAFNYDENVFAAYANYSKSWDKWDLNFGIRAEQTNIEGKSITLNQTNKQDYLNWFPTLSVAHQISDDVSINGNYKRSITRPNYTNLNPFTFFLNENTVYLGNPNLVPTYIDYYKVGVDFLEYFSVEAYYTKYDGDIVELPRQNNNTNILAWTPANLDNKVDYGFDFLFNYYPSSRFGLSVTASVFNVTEEANFGNESVELSQWSQLLIISPNLSLLEDNSLNIYASFWWTNKHLQNLQTIEDLLLSSISISKTVFNNKGVISLSVEDLFNMQDYNNSVNYLNQSSTSFTDLDTRYIKLGFRYKFGNTKLNTNERSTSEEGRDRLKDLN